ncbi:hypothetical protein [Roseobacter sp. S98]|uniref:hypothetical protein n=1 Tax=Roseobacter algicola (ex Choi et al. 2025) (nom. illeg.) TaxID=3092138 RepID=UPI0035C756BB
MLTMEDLQNANVIIALMIGLFTIISAVILWFDRRQKAFATAAAEKAAKTSDDLAGKVKTMDEDLAGVADDVGSLRKDISSLSSRVHGVERSMETVARQSDLSALNVELKQLTGTVTAEIRVLSNMMHSFHVSALRAAERKDKR